MSANIILEKYQVLLNNLENNLLSMRDKITTVSIVAILAMVLFTSSFSVVNADDIDSCPPPNGVFVRITVLTVEGNEEGVKTFSAKSYSTNNTDDSEASGSVSKSPDKHSKQLNNSVGKPVTIEIVDCGITEEGSDYRYVTTITGTIDSFSQSGGSGPPVETITFSITSSEVEYTETG